MAISNLVSGGQSFERPSVSAFFGNAPRGANDNVQRVSSDFLGNDVLKAITGAIDRISGELSRLQDVSKNIIKSFEALIKSTRELNRDITKKFTDVNNELNRSKIEFLRSLMMTPIPASDSPTRLGALVDNVQQKQEESKKQEEKKDEGKSWTDTLGDWLGTAGDIAIGHQASQNRTTAAASIAIGYQAMYNDTTGIASVAIGAYSMIASLDRKSTRLNSSH